MPNAPAAFIPSGTRTVRMKVLLKEEEILIEFSAQDFAVICLAYQAGKGYNT